MGGNGKRPDWAWGARLHSRLGPAVGLGLVDGLGGLGWGYVVPGRVGVGRLGADAVGQGSEADGFEVAGEAVEGLAVLVGLEEDVGGA